MTRLLGPACAGVLAPLARARVLLAFDFDGTLAPIVATRDDAAMRPRTARLLAQLCARYPCAVISGRGRADVAARLGGAAVKYVVGNHGLEPGGDLRRIAREVARVREALRVALRAEPGVDLEDKRYSLALHYRRAPRKRHARAACLAAVAALPVPTRVVLGKLVVNLVPARAPHKGDALTRLRSAEGARTALYVGDDVTDEDVFALPAPERLVSVRVGASRTSAARYFLREQRELDVMLARLVALRPETPVR